MKLRTGVLATIACAIVLFGASLAAQIPAPAESPALTPAGESDPIATAQSIYHEAMQIEERDARLAAFERARLHFDRAVRAVDADANADLYTDLGNAALQGEQLGSAILSYRRALAVDPDHPRAKQNLDHARSLLPSWVPRPPKESALDALFFWHHTLSRTERHFAAALFFALAVCGVALSVWRGRSLWRNLAILPAIAWVALLGSALFEVDHGADDGVIVVTGGEPALSADSPNARPVFGQSLPEGAEVRILERRDEWVRIHLADASRSAWVRRGSVETIRSSE